MEQELKHNTTQKCVMLIIGKSLQFQVQFQNVGEFLTR